MQKYTNFRIHQDTHQELRKLRAKLKADSLDEVIKHLLETKQILDNINKKYLLINK